MGGGDRSRAGGAHGVPARRERPAREPRLRDAGAAAAHAVDLRRLAWALGAIGGALLVLGAVSAIFYEEKALLVVTLFDTSVGQSVPPLVSGGLVGASGLLALGIPRRQRALTALGWLLVVLGIDEAIGAHETLQSAADLSPAVTWLPVVVLTGLLLAACLRALASARALFLSGGLLWLVAHAAELLLGADASDAGRYAKEAFELVASPVLFLAFLVAFRAATARPAAAGAPGLALLQALSVRAVAATLAVAIVSLAGLAVLAHRAGVDAHVFRMTDELTWPAHASTALLAAAAALAAALRRLLREKRSTARGAQLLAAVFALLAADELLAIHEALGRAVGVKEGQLLLLPVVPPALVGWIRLARWLRGALLALWIAGLAAWSGAVAVDTLHPSPRGLAIILEDTLELVGTGAFVLALLGGARRAVG